MQSSSRVRLHGETGRSAASCRSAVSIRFNNGVRPLLLAALTRQCWCSAFRQLSQVSRQGVESPRVRGFGSVYRSVVAVVGIAVCVGRIVRTTKAVVVIAAASEAVPSAAEATVTDVRDATCAQAADAACVKAGHASPEAAHVAPAKAAHVPSAKATAHMASAKAAATAMATTTTTAAAAGLGTSRQQASGEHCARQNHHYSSSHDILLWDGRTIRHRSSQTSGTSEGKRQRRDGVKMGMLTPRLY